MDLLLATKNEGKIRELKVLMSDLPIRLHGLNKFPNIPDVEETGATFVQNAVLKAQGYAKKSGIFALADDSGIEVFGLGRAPGVYSARYAGEFSTDEEKMDTLLLELRRNSEGNRSARFVCVMALADPSGFIVKVVSGVCRGTIAEERRGNQGFGYDPIFIPDGFQESFGELPGTVKHQISHRSRALNKIIRHFKTITAA